MTDTVDTMLGEEDAADTAAMKEMEAEETSPPVEEPEDVSAEPSEDESAGGEATEEKEEEKPVMVPVGALQEERQRRQAVESQVGNLTQQIANMEKTFQQVLDRAQKAGEPPPPDFDVDPDAYTRHKLETIEQKLAAEEKDRKASSEEQQRTQQAQQFLNMYANAAKQFAAEQPDAREAYDFVMKEYDRELELRGYTDPADRQRRLEMEEEQIVVRAFQQGANPAKRLYELAKSRGYKPKQSEEDKLTRLAETEKATSPIANTGGEGGKAPVTLARLAELNGDEFDKAWAKAQAAGQLG